MTCRLHLALTTAATLLAAAAGAGEPPTTPSHTAYIPSEHWGIDFESGALWRITDKTSADYLILPQIISLRTPEHFRLGLGSGELTLRSRVSLLIEPVVEGPEDLYLGWSGSPTLEYWSASRRAAIYASAGGGFGWIDSGSTPGGQGQDFTLNWFASAGVRFYLRPNLAFSAGVMFQHLSNGGATDPNPGLDALGPIVGFTWHF